MKMWNAQHDAYYHTNTPSLVIVTILESGQYPHAQSSIILAGLSLIITNHEGPGIRSLIPDVMIRTPDSDFCDPDNTFIDFR